MFSDDDLPSVAAAPAPSQDGTNSRPSAPASADSPSRRPACNKAARAAKAREARAVLAAQRAAAAGPAVQQTWANAKHERAARALWSPSQPFLTSALAAARHLGVDYRFLSRLVIASASEALAAERRAFARLLRELQEAKAAGIVEPIHFTLCRMYDETPTRAWTHEVLPSGALSGQVSVAKVMASAVSFVMVVRVAPRSAPDLAASQVMAGQEVSGDLAEPGVGPRPHLHILQGSLATRLAAMANQTQEVVYEAITTTMSLTDAERQLVEELFPHVSVVRLTDLHRSSMPAERQLSRDHPRWPSGLFRCSMHRARTAERWVIALDPRTESFYLNYTLALRQPDAQRALRARVLDWAQTNLRIIHGPPPAEVVAWRRSMEPWMFDSENLAHSQVSAQLDSDDLADSQGSARQATRAAMARRYCWDAVTNGDGRARHELQHYCSPTCCPGGRPQTVSKLLGPLGVSALLQPAPPVFPRRSWHGQCECMAQVIQLEATHGLLSQHFRPIEVAARQRAAKALERLAAEARRQQETAVGPATSRAGTSASEADPAATDPATSFAVGGLAAAHAHAAYAEQAAQTCRDVLDFLTSPDPDRPLRDMVRMRVLLQPFRELKSSILHRTGSPWQGEQMVRAVNATLADLQGAAAKGTLADSQGAAAKARPGPRPRRQQFPVTVATHGQEVRTALTSIGQLMQGGGPTPWEVYKHMGPMPPDCCLRWRCLSRAGAALTQLMLHEQSVYPWRLFRILAHDSAAAQQAAEEVAADAQICSRILDPSALAHWQRHSSVAALLSPSSTAELLGMATVIADNTSSIERGHASVKRADRARSQTHTARLVDSSAVRVLRQLQLAAASWQGRAADVATPGRVAHAGPANSRAGRRSASHAIPQDGSRAAGPAKSRAGARAAASARPQPRRRKKIYPVTRCAAWMSAHVSGRLITKEDYQQYRQAGSGRGIVVVASSGSLD